MFKILLALHLLFAVFAIGPLVHAATTASRGVRTGDGTATAGSARMLRIYAYASVLVVLVGMGLMSAKEDGKKVGEISDLWIWLSLVLWVVAIGLILGVVVPTLNQATTRIANEESVVALTGRVAAAGGVVGVIFAAIVFVMVYRPGG
ncbi:MAG TPA: hypothetical protein VHS54_02900 [Jatrophihabitans sp.]|jgi:hypothetical protein|nr:hypothetical protein [Jatrophihabitans sp.]